MSADSVESPSALEETVFTPFTAELARDDR